MNTAIISGDGLYRYTLGRKLGGDRTRGLIVWIMLNPSTADASTDDPTISKIMRFSAKWGYANLTVVNLYAFRATDPKLLRGYADPVGYDNDYHIAQAAMAAERIMVAWGCKPEHQQRAAEVTASLRDLPLFCLATGKDGAPKHPLYQRETLVPVPWSVDDLESAGGRKPTGRQEENDDA